MGLFLFRPGLVLVRLLLGLHFLLFLLLPLL